MPRSKTLCALCSETSPYKMASFYWRWTWPSDDRRGYKQFFDYECSRITVGEIQRCDQEVAICPHCHQPVEQYPSIVVWVTYYLPKQPRMDAGLEYHVACFEKAHQRFLVNAIRLPDRTIPEVGGGGPPAPNPWDSWERQGIGIDVEAPERALS